jgi:hypothetical protein
MKWWNARFAFRVFNGSVSFDLVEEFIVEFSKEIALGFGFHLER